jgi:two-component system, OmpR family, sensor kinase
VTSVTGTPEVGDAIPVEPGATPGPGPGVAIPLSQSQPSDGVETVTPERQDWYRAVRSVRTRILAAYVILIALSAAIALLGVRSLLHSQLEERVQEALEQEIREFDQLVTVGIDPRTGNRFRSVNAVFEVYLDRNVPSQEEGILTFVNGEIDRTVLAEFPLDRMPSERLEDWEARSRPVPGEAESAVGRFDTRLGEAFFRARRVVISDEEGGRSNGALIVTILPAAELEDIGDLQTYGAAGALAILLLASAVAWFVAGRVLAPVRLLTETARSISESDLTHRIEIRGGGEAADMARSFNNMLDRLESVFRSQRQFIQDASHELRDPLTICRGHLELLGDDPEERRATTALVLDELDRIGRIVDDLQLLAEAEHPDFLRREWADLELLTHELVAKATALAPRRWTLDSVGTGTVFADRQRITEAVMNLAHNAVQHTVAHDSIAIGTSSTPNEARIWVRDSGSGIAVEDQTVIFDRFKRGGDAHRRYRGGGLGLAIVKTVAEAHGGRVELESRLGEGSMFTIVLPIETEHRSSWWPGS